MKTEVKMKRLKRWKNWKEDETITNLLYKNELLRRNQSINEWLIVELRKQ
jgi:hypothetical protein